jgi:hypothetical protein
MKARRLAAGLIATALLVASCTSYDHDRPDTGANREGFRRHIGFVPPADVSDLYYYADEFGADCTYQLGFKADARTVDRIVAALALTPADGPQDVGVAREFPVWWQTSDYRPLVPWQRVDVEKDYYRYLWYDSDSQRAYYLEFSM